MAFLLANIGRNKHPTQNSKFSVGYQNGG